MRTRDLPQDDGGFMHASRFHTYAMDGAGDYAIRASRGWQPVNEAILAGWDLLDAEARALAAEVHAGRASPIAYFMLMQQMDATILAPLVGIARWRVRRHRRGQVFARLKPELIERYARAFGIEPGLLTDFPTEPPLPSAFHRESVRFYQHRADPDEVAERSGGDIVVHNRIEDSRRDD